MTKDIGFLGNFQPVIISILAPGMTYDWSIIVHIGYTNKDPGCYETVFNFLNQINFNVE